MEIKIDFEKFVYVKCKRCIPVKVNLYRKQALIVRMVNLTRVIYEGYLGNSVSWGNYLHLLNTDLMQQLKSMMVKTNI